MTERPPIPLEFDLPAQPQSLVRLAALLREDGVNLFDVGALIDADMSLAAAVMTAVNAPVYGLRGRVQTVQQAVSYLGVREISAIVYETGLQAAFPQVPALVAVWDRARVRGLVMGRLAQALAMEAWGPHTAGLFEESGKAVLFRHDPDGYPALLAAAADDVALVALEKAHYGAGHDELGGRLCEAWGLAPAAVASVRWHVVVAESGRLPRVSQRYICVLSALAHAAMTDPSRLDELAMKLAPQAMLDQATLLRGLERVKGKLDDAIENG